MRTSKVVAVSVKFCRRCHRLLAPWVIVCAFCASVDLKQLRCRVDKRDLPAYSKTFPMRKP